MVGAVGENQAASSMMNAFLRELGGSRGGRRSSAPHTVERAEGSRAIGGKSELTEEERREVEELKQRDAEVRRHEAAHKAAAGSFAKGGPQFEFTRGPDGRQYASGGEVQIDTSEVSGDPRATLRKMQQIRQAANAPANPSSQDRAVAAQAARQESAARAELAQQGLDDGASPAAGVDVAARFSQPASSGQFIDVSA